MLRAFAKGAVLFLFGRMPGGARIYRELTRNRMGTQATHVDKLLRVWPGYVQVWQSECGLELEGLDVWIHEAGWTPFGLFANYLLTGKAGVITNSEGRLLDRYLARAVNGALALRLTCPAVSEERCRRLEPLRWYEQVGLAVSEIGGSDLMCERGKLLEMEADSKGLCHSGGALEHYRPEELRFFLAECFRILRPGGIASHVFDHRDHLHHADKHLPFLAHLAWPDWAYSICCGHPLGYHNRLLPTDIEGMFREAGFERIAVRRMILPDRRYVIGSSALSGKRGVSRALLRGKYRKASEEDLRTAAAHYLYRKPE